MFEGLVESVDAPYIQGCSPENNSMEDLWTSAFLRLKPE